MRSADCDSFPSSGTALRFELGRVRVAIAGEGTGEVDAVAAGTRGVRHNAAVRGANTSAAVSKFSGTSAARVARDVVSSCSGASGSRGGAWSGVAAVAVVGTAGTIASALVDAATVVFRVAPWGVRSMREDDWNGLACVGGVVVAAAA